MKQKAYAYKTTNAKSLNKSTSGGAFYKICELFFQFNDGVVYGVVMDSHAEVIYDRKTSLEECSAFQKSKYVKSDWSVCRLLIEKDLMSGKKVLFSGLPCHVYALNKYLDSRSISKENLITIDLICNGAPTTKLWNDYKAWLESIKGSKLTYFGFRENGDKLNPYLTHAEFANGKSLHDHPLTACYNRLFLKKLIIPNSCFKCPFKQQERYSDITIGDFWGSKNEFSEESLKEKVSLVLVNTIKGDNLFNDKQGKMGNGVIKECQEEQYLKYQHNLSGKQPFPKNYNTFWDDYNQFGFGYVAKKYGDAYYPNSLLYLIRKIVRRIKSLF